LDDLDYMQARMYSPVLGRFLGVDSAPGSPSSPQSWNRYTYALDNPAQFIDPDGLAPQGVSTVDSTSLQLRQILDDVLKGNLEGLIAAARPKVEMRIDPDILLKPELSPEEAKELAEVVQGIRGKAREGLETTRHGEERREQAAYDPDRQIGDPNRVVIEGRSFRDTRDGTIVYVKGDRAVVVNSDGKEVTTLRLRRRAVQKRIEDGRFIPIIEPE
jgi:hypothetical protein